MTFIATILATVMCACCPIAAPINMTPNFTQTNSAVVQNYQATKVLGNEKVIPGIAKVINDNKTDTVKVTFYVDATVDLAVQISNLYYTTSVEGCKGNTVALKGTDAKGKVAKINNIWIMGAAEKVVIVPATAYEKYVSYTHEWHRLVVASQENSDILHAYFNNLNQFHFVDLAAFYDAATYGEVGKQVFFFSYDDVVKAAEAVGRDADEYLEELTFLIGEGIELIKSLADVPLYKMAQIDFVRINSEIEALYNPAA